MSKETGVKGVINCSFEMGDRVYSKWQYSSNKSARYRLNTLQIEAARVGEEGLALA